MLALRSGGTFRAGSTIEQRLTPPSYVKVPIVSEDPETIFADMPDLRLAGPCGASKQEAAPELAAGLSLEQPLACEEVPPAAAAAQEAVAMPPPRFAVLENGFRVISVDRHGLCASLGLFVHAGSCFFTEETSALPHALEMMSFHSSKHLSHLRTMKTVEQLGASASCRVGREDILYQVDVLREYVPVMVPLMLANVLCPSLLPDEVAGTHQHVYEMQQSLAENPESLVCELLQMTAYKDNTLGLPLYASEKDLPLITPESLRHFISENCTPDRLLLVGINVDFDELCKWSMRSFAELGPVAPPAAPRPAQPKLPIQYTGGEHRIEQPGPLAHLMFGWEVEGGWNGKYLAAITVLQMLLGGGGSFSTGGPGKGMHTRLYTHVLNRYAWVESCQASTVMHSDSGLFTVYATVLPGYADDFVTVLGKIFQSLSQIRNEELLRAKNALKSSIHMNLEMRAVMMEDLGRQLILSGSVGTTQDFAKMIDEVTHADLVAALQHCLAKAPTVVAYGQIERLGSYDAVTKRFAASSPPAVAK